MKTVCKKLLCLMLVAMMLVSAVPFAFATEVNELSVDIYVVEDGVNMGCAGALTVADTVELTQSLAEQMVRMTDREFLGWENNSGKDVTNGELKNDEWLSNALANGYYLVVNVTSTACKHPESKLTTTNTATCGQDGVKTVKCECGEVISTEEVGATGNHSYNGGTCTVCGATRDAIGSITFHYMTSANVWTEKTVDIYENNQEIAPPTVSSVRGFYFQGWSSVRNGAVDLSAGNKIVWNSGTSRNYWATYDDDADDELVHVTVKVAYYVDGKWHNNETLLTSPDFNKNEDDNQMFRWLYNDGFNQINNALFANGDNVDYKWNKVFYLNYKGTDKVDSEMMDDGNKTVYVVLNSKDYIEANVQLYVHKSASSTVYDIIDMDGYTAGDVVTRSDVKEVLEDKNYSYSSLSYLYSQTEWENLLNGDNTDPDSEVTVANNGTTKIHVIAKNAKTSSSTADTTNPKTGDTIMIAVTTMALAAAGLVSMIELKKRKMI